MQAQKEPFEYASQACQAFSAHLSLDPSLASLELCLEKDPNMHYKSKWNFINKMLECEKD
jgi:hypothetical protein